MILLITVLFINAISNYFNAIFDLKYPTAVARAFNISDWIAVSDAKAPTNGE